MKEYLKVEQVLDLISGTSDNGNDWEKQQVVFSTTGDNPVTLAIDFMGERKTRTTKTLKRGQICEVVYMARSREYGDRWYTNLDGIAVKPLVEAKDESPAPANAPAAQEQPPVAMPEENAPDFVM